MNATTRAGAPLLALPLLLLLGGAAAAQEEPVEAGATPPPAAAQDEAPPSRRFRIGGEVKAHFRSSSAEEVELRFPFPPSFIPPGQTAVFSRTVSEGPSFEFSTATLDAEGELGGGVAAKASVHFSDLYNRNPTSSDDRVFVREAWIRIGDKHEALQPMPGTSLYVLLGKAPRFSKQIIRRLESYGLWGTAVGRFENPQLQLGGSFGRNVYWRGSIGNGNPVFFRDVERAGGRQRHAGARAGRRQADLRVGLPDPLRRQGAGRELHGRVRVRRRARPARGRRLARDRRARLVLPARDAAGGAPARHVLRRRPRPAEGRRLPAAVLRQRQARARSQPGGERRRLPPVRPVRRPGDRGRCPAPASRWRPRTSISAERPLGLPRRARRQLDPGGRALLDDHQRLRRAARVPRPLRRLGLEEVRLRPALRPGTRRRSHRGVRVQRRARKGRARSTRTSCWRRCARGSRTGPGTPRGRAASAARPGAAGRGCAGSAAARAGSGRRTRRSLRPGRAGRP